MWGGMPHYLSIMQTATGYVLSVKPHPNDSNPTDDMLWYGKFAVPPSSGTQNVGTNMSFYFIMSAAHPNVYIALSSATGRLGTVVVQGDVSELPDVRNQCAWNVSS
jgi:hypothetical protein